MKLEWKRIKIVVFAMFMTVLGATMMSTDADAASYKIKINKQQNVVTVYKKKAGKYKAYKAFVCSAGYATPTGTFRLGEKLRWHTLDGPSYGQYCTRITGSILFHSVWYYQQSKTTQSYIQYNRLGTTASHGCVRMTTIDCKWIYDNVPSGTPVTIYNSKKPGPLGKPKAIKVKGYSGWDPTDPDRANPYHKKKPTIKINKDTNIAYASKFDIKKGVTVKNSTGFNAKSLLKYKIQYRVDKKSKYKKVKSVSTTKPGYYKVTYSITDEIKHKAKKTVTFRVLTKVNVSSITLSAKSKTLYLGTTASKAKFTLKVKKLLPKTATVQKVQYLTSNAAVATVSSKGVVTAKKAGNAVITVKATDGSGTQATCTVTVLQYMKSLQLTAPSTTLDVGNAMQLRNAVTPTDTSNKTLTYTSSNTTIATVSASGSVTALSPGTVTITATAKDGSGVSASITLQIGYKYGKTTTTVAPVTVDVGTTWNDVLAKLPTSVTIADVRGKTTQASVSWSCASYVAATAGTYKATGKVTLPGGWYGAPSNMSVDIIVQTVDVE